MRHFAGFGGACLQNVFDAAWVGSEFGEVVAFFSQFSVNQFKQLLFRIAPADAIGVSLFHCCLLLFVGKRLVDFKQRAAVYFFGLAWFQAVGHDFHHRFAQFFLAFKQRDGVAIRFAHFATI